MSGREAERMVPNGVAGTLIAAEQYRAGRNFVRIGDVVRVRAMPGRRNGFLARVRAIKVDQTTGGVVEVEVFGGPAGREMVRTFVPERIARVARTRAGGLRGPKE